MRSETRSSAITISPVANGRPASLSSRSAPAGCFSRTTELTSRREHSRTVNDVDPSVTLSGAWMSITHSNGERAACSELDNEFGEEDIDHLLFLQDRGYCGCNRLFELFLAFACDQRLCVLLGEQLQDGR